MIHIIADTLSSISVGEAKKLGIEYIPQLIIFGDKTYRDDNEITSEEFIEKLQQSHVNPKTAAPQPVLYEKIFAKIENNNDTGIVLCPSAKLSGTYRSAKIQAEEHPNADIRVIDTGLITTLLGTVVLKAVEMAKSGAPAERIIDEISSLSKTSRAFFIVDTLEYLHRGGRIGLAKKLLGSILDMKPILTLEDGQVAPYETHRTKKKAIKRIIDLILSECPHEKESYLSIVHGGNVEEADFYAEELSEKLNIRNIWVTFAPPAILVHTGPGVLGFVFFNAQP